MNVTRHFTLIYLLSLLFLGIGYLCILPPFEGFDETGHFSSMRQLAATGAIPISGRSFLDKEVTDYQGPMPYSTGAPPFDRGMTYAKFFADTDSVIRYNARYRKSSSLATFRASSIPNGESQHPPLYYALMTPFDGLADLLSLSLYWRISLFRLVSYAMALVGVGFGFAAARDRSRSLSTDPAVIGFLLYPFILPMFFHEFARMGNDALCLLWIGLTAFLLSKWVRCDQNKQLSFAIGVVLGLGLLTKAFFVPIVGIISIWLVVRSILSNRATSLGTINWVPSCLIIVPAIILGGGWYLFNFFNFGVLSGSHDAMYLASQGGFIANIVQKFSLITFVGGIAAIFATYSWAGTWSLVRVPALLQLLMLIPAAAIFAAFTFRLRHYSATSLEWLGVWIFAAFLGGLIYHVAMSIASLGIPNTPGYYLHILMPWVAPWLGIGCAALFPKSRPKIYLAFLIAYSAVFQAIAIWSEIALFTGCATKSANKYYAFSGDKFCLDELHLIFERMLVLGQPTLAVLSFSAGITGYILLLCALETPSNVFLNKS